MRLHIGTAIRVVLYGVMFGITAYSLIGLSMWIVFLLPDKYGVNNLEQGFIATIIIFGLDILIALFLAVYLAYRIETRKRRSENRID